jgi:hypothetical protein
MLAPTPHWGVGFFLIMAKTIAFVDGFNLYHAMALFLLVRALQQRYDKAIIFSGDTDLLPAVKMVRGVFPAKQIGLVIPIGRASEDFKQQADFHYKMREHHLAKSQFPDPLVLPDGTLLIKPLNWV